MPRQEPATSSVSLTSSILLEGLKDSANRVIWQRYVDRYRPIIVQYGRRLGLSPADADDAAQHVLIEFCTAYQAGKYDRQRGRLRDWLLGIARNQVLNHRRRRVARGEVQIAADGTHYFDQVADDDALSNVWEEEWQSAVLQQCLAAVRAEVHSDTFRAFELFALQGIAAEEVAAELNTTANAVFSAKRRILRRIRELLPQMETEW